MKKILTATMLTLVILTLGVGACGAPTGVDSLFDDGSPRPLDLDAGAEPCEPVLDAAPPDAAPPPDDAAVAAAEAACVKSGAAKDAACFPLLWVNGSNPYDSTWCGGPVMLCPEGAPMIEKCGAIPWTNVVMISHYRPTCCPP